jgi:hypothetical protein
MPTPNSVRRIPTPNSARRAPREKKEEKRNNGREEKDERGRSKLLFNSPADFYRMGQVKEEVGAIPIHTALRPKKESFHQLPPSRRNDNPNQSSSWRDGDPKSEWNHRQRE